MTTALQLRRGTTSDHATFTGAVGEVTIDTTKKVAVVHDGATAGGIPQARADQVLAKTSNLSDLANAATARANLGVAIGADVQGFDANTVKKNVANAYSAQQYAAEATLTDAATVAWDVAAAQVAKVTLAGNRTFGAPTNMVAGAFYGLLVVQDATGSRTGAWNSVFKFPTATAPTLTTTANAKDFFVFRSDGTNMYLVGKSMDVR
jgi:hypothetical protein